MVDGGDFDLLACLVADGAVVWLDRGGGKERSVDAGFLSQVFDDGEADIGALDHFEQAGATFDGGQFGLFEDGVVMVEEEGRF